MRFLELDLLAYGPFSNTRIDLAGGHPGLHVIHGPNEAGKSSALRALIAFLFGMPHRTTDNFVHANRDLRIGAHLRAADGREIRLVRRKARKRMLRDPETDAPVGEGEEVLGPFLGGVTQEAFEQLFGIDHARLVEGGAEILRQGGAVGEALFGAGFGGVPVHAVLRTLHEEARQLFLPGGSVPVLNRLLARHREARAEASQAALRPREWHDAAAARSAAQSECDRLGAELTRLTGDKSRLERIRRVAPLLAERRRLRLELLELGSLPAVAPDFVERRTALRGDHVEALGRREASRVRRAQLVTARGALGHDAAILEHAAAIDALGEVLGGQLQAEERRARLQGERDAACAAARALLAELRPDLAYAAIEELRPLLGAARRLGSLGNQRPLLEQRLGHLRRAEEDAQQALQEVVQSLEGEPPFQDLEELNGALEAAQKVGDLDGEIAARREDLQTGRTELAAAALRLGLGQQTVERLEVLHLPELAALDEFAALQERRRDERAALDRSEAEAQSLRATSRQTLETIEHAGDVPAEEDLAEQRTARDRLWTDLVGRWAAGGPVDHPALTTYGERVVAADAVADRLRREADRVHSKAEALAAWRRAEEILERCSRRREALVAEEDAVAVRWRSLWQDTAGIEPQSVNAMRTWHAQAERLRERAGQLRTAGDELSRLMEQRRRLTDRLAAALGEPGPEPERLLGPLLDQGSRRRDAIAQSNRTRRDLEERLPQLRRSRERATAEARAARETWQRWEGDWEEAIAPLGLPSGTPPEEAVAAMDRLRELFRLHDHSQDLARQVERVASDFQAFAQRVQEVWRTALGGQTEEPTVVAMRQLRELLREAREDRARRAELDRQIEGLDGEIAEVDAELEGLQTQLAVLRAPLNCATEEEADALQRRIEAAADLRGRLAEAESGLAHQGDGTDPDALEAESRGEDPDLLPGRIQVLEERIQGVQGQLSAAAATLGERSEQLRRWEGGDLAAAAAQRAQMVLAELRGAAEAYVRVRLAATVLQGAIERYRAANEAPLLGRAGELFARLTLGSFAGLQVDYAGEEAVLVGQRPDARRLAVAEMSDGTRDQLFLALRLAAVELRVQAGEPLPLVVDDILVNFDDARSRATLEVLGGLAAHTQVILFTHHESVAAAAETLACSAGSFVHRLPVPGHPS